MIGPLADEIAISVRRSERTACEQRAAFDPASPCVYCRGGMCTCGPRPLCKHAVAGVCACGGLVGREGVREYRGGPPEQMAEECDA
ncbi:MAG TPA: hypothetical protein VFH17_08595 [Coriobacteriia bacterium]|nr:hypothetical protein [Coriobacteriia bacterium]